MPKTIINGVRTYYETHGKGQPLVLVQGFAGEHHAWFFQVPAFRRYFRLIIMDTRGMGDTECSKEPYTIRTVADDVVSLMDMLDIPSAHILGLSLGGLVAQEIAITYPERVRKLVLGCTFASADVANASLESKRAFGVAGDSGEQVRNVDVDRLMDFMVSSAFNNPLYRGSIQLLRKIPVPVDPRGHIDQINAARGYSAIGRLHLIKAPTLVITGAADRLVPPENSEFLAAHIPGARLVKIPDGSHAFFMEKSGAFNREVLKFLLE